MKIRDKLVIVIQIEMGRTPTYNQARALPLKSQTDALTSEFDGKPSVWIAETRTEFTFRN